jgi:hypothetical protein
MIATVCWVLLTVWTSDVNWLREFGVSEFVFLSHVMLGWTGYRHMEYCRPCNSTHEYKYRGQGSVVQLKNDIQLRTVSQQMARPWLHHDVVWCQYVTLRHSSGTSVVLFTSVRKVRRFSRNLQILNSFVFRPLMPKLTNSRRKMLQKWQDVVCTLKQNIAFIVPNWNSVHADHQYRISPISVTTYGEQGTRHDTPVKVQRYPFASDTSRWVASTTFRPP